MELYHRSGLTPSQSVNVRAVVPISVNLVSFHDGVDLAEFVLAQRDVNRSEVFQDPCLVGGTRDGNDVRTWT